MPDTQKSAIVFTYHHPGRTFEGTPYDAAEQAVWQSQRVVALLDKSLDDTLIQVRNAWMQRNIDLGGSPNAADFEESAEGRLMISIAEMNKTMDKKLGVLRKAASYDPKNPPKED